jgi:hypothetical protein
MQKIFSLFSVFIFAPVLASYSFPVPTFAEDNAGVSKVIITEVRPGGEVISGTDFKEYVTLYNQSPDGIDDLSDWTLEYAKSTFNPLYCSSASWKNAYTSSPVNTIALTGSIEPGTAVTFGSTSSINDNVSGSIRLLDATGTVQDLTGWGSSTACFESSPAPLVSTNKSIHRYLDCNTSIPVDTDDNSTDFVLSSDEYPPSPGVLSGPVTDDCQEELPEDEEEPPEGGLGGGSQSSCAGVVISELLPNPTGLDNGHEFIELFNPTNDFIPLAGCMLQTSANSKIFTFSQSQLNPGQYKAFYDSTTGLTLANSAGGSVYLINTDDSEIDQADYDANLEDNVSWSLIDGNWQETFSVTPNSANKLLETKPCPAGQFRNTETNRCNNIVTEAAGLASCLPGKERNPATNRCRNISSFASTLKACAPDQFRNPQTNRCKKIASSSSLKPCKPGQERNPETNRCRKLSASSSSGGINDVKDVLSAGSPASKISWLMAGGGVLGALGYGAWEWRNELSQKLAAIKNKFL